MLSDKNRSGFSSLKSQSFLLTDKPHRAVPQAPLAIYTFEIIWRGFRKETFTGTLIKMV